MFIHHEPTTLLVTIQPMRKNKDNCQLQKNFISLSAWEISTIDLLDQDFIMLDFNMVINQWLSCSSFLTCDLRLMTDQPFEFLLPITEIANGVVVLVHRLLCFWRMDRQQEAYNIIPWPMTRSRWSSLGISQFALPSDTWRCLPFGLASCFGIQWLWSWIIKVNFLNILQ